MFAQLAKTITEANIPTLLSDKGVWGCVYFDGPENNSAVESRIATQRVDISANGRAFTDALEEACRELGIKTEGKRNPMLFVVQGSEEGLDGPPCSVLLDPDYEEQIGLKLIHVEFWCFFFG